MLQHALALKLNVSILHLGKYSSKNDVMIQNMTKTKTVSSSGQSAGFSMTSSVFSEIKNVVKRANYP